MWGCLFTLCPGQSLNITEHTGHFKYTNTLRFSKISIAWRKANNNNNKKRTHVYIKHELICKFSKVSLIVTVNIVILSLGCSINYYQHQIYFGRIRLLILTYSIAKNSSTPLNFQLFLLDTPSQSHKLSKKIIGNTNR